MTELVKKHIIQFREIFVHLAFGTSMKKMKIKKISIDIGKTAFHLIALNQEKVDSNAKCNALKLGLA